MELPVKVMDQALASPAAEWFEDDYGEFESMLETLYERRARVPDLLWAGKQAARDPFTKWVHSEAWDGKR